MSSFWDELKKLLKTKQQVADDKAQRIGEASANEGALVDALRQLEEQLGAEGAKQETDYTAMFPEELNLEKVEYTAPTDEELKARAEAALQPDYTEAAVKVEEDIKNKEERLSSSVADAVKKKQATLAEVDALYSSMKDAAEKDALKRGMARSSVISERLKEYDKERGVGAAQVAGSYDALVADLTTEINGLSSERLKSLEQLDLSYAADLGKKIDALTAERTKLQKEAVKANNEIAEREAEYKSERARAVEDYKAEQQTKELKAAEELAAYEAEHGYSGKKQANYADRYNMALEFYLGLDADIAADALKASGNMQYYLGNYYDKLMEVLKERALASDRYNYYKE